MARPPKAVSVIRLENKSHRTKAELATREKNESALLTGTKIKAKASTKRDIVAYKEFKRVQKLLAAIDKDDALYENVINRYCQLYAECNSLEVSRERIFEMFLETEEEALMAQMLSIDKQIQTKRDMMFKIEKENLMTVAASLRSVPKQVAVEEDPHTGMFG